MGIATIKKWEDIVMAMRVLSGVILPHPDFRHCGSATIKFHPHSVSGDVSPIESEDMEEAGPDAPFNSEPCKTVSLRRIKFDDQDHSRPSEAVNVDRKGFNIDDKFDGTRKNSLTVLWEADGSGAEIREISYMIIGDAG
jgi:hypothetical protein